MDVLEITGPENGHIRVRWQRGNTSRECPHPIPFTDPMSVKDREKLRWYLEEYLQFPYGAERDKAHHVEEKMKEWGELLFNQVFAKCDFDPDPRTFYQEAVREGLDTCELCITSENTAFLNITLNPSSKI